jgi:hypothetical protein
MSMVVLSPDDIRLLAGAEARRQWLLDVDLPGRVVLSSGAFWFDWFANGDVAGLQQNGALMRYGLDGASEPRHHGQLPNLAGLMPQDLSQDGKTLLFMRPGLRGLFELDVDTATTSHELKSLLEEDVPAFDARFSPDGAWIVYATTEANRNSLFVQPRSGPRRRRQIACGRRSGVARRWQGDRLSRTWQRVLRSLVGRGGGRSRRLAVRRSRATLLGGSSTAGRPSHP